MIGAGAPRFVISVAAGEGQWRQRAWSDAAYPGQTIRDWCRDTLPCLLGVDEGTEIRIDLVDETEEVTDTEHVTFHRQPR